MSREQEKEREGRRKEEGEKEKKKKKKEKRKRRVGGKRERAAVGRIRGDGRPRAAVTVGSIEHAQRSGDTQRNRWDEERKRRDCD